MEIWVREVAAKCLTRIAQLEYVEPGRVLVPSKLLKGLLCCEIDVEAHENVSALTNVAVQRRGNRSGRLWITVRCNALLGSRWSEGTRSSQVTSRIRCAPRRRANVGSAKLPADAIEDASVTT
jgi:hypothetical protein